MTSAAGVREEEATPDPEVADSSGQSSEASSRPESLRFEIFTFAVPLTTSRNLDWDDGKKEVKKIVIIGPDHVQMTKVFWRLKVNWKNLKQKFKNMFEFTLLIVNHVLRAKSIGIPIS